MRSPHRISLLFEEAQVGQLRISEFLEAALNSALLPRTSLQHGLLLFLREVGGVRLERRCGQAQEGGWPGLGQSGG